jgi:hypothetical protein
MKLSARFDKPTAHPEILRQLPLELRDDTMLNSRWPGTTADDIPVIKDVLNYTLQLPDPTNPQYLTQVDVIKIPNANNIGWDNMKKYRE